MVGPEVQEFDRLLTAQRRFQSLVDGAVLVGGTAAVLHARHRVSLDGDHVLPDLRERFQEILSRLEATGGWRTERIQAPVLILGSLDGALTGLRQLRRARPLEVEVVEGLRIPSLKEMARIKGWLFLTRGTTRDLLDLVVLLEKLGERGALEAFSSFGEIYGRGPRAGHPLVELADRMGEATPHDLSRTELKTYRGVVPPWNDEGHLKDRARFWGERLARKHLEP